MTARRDGFRHFSRRLQVGWLGLCALLVLAVLAGSRAGAQSTPAQETPSTPAQQTPSTPVPPAPAQPAPDQATPTSDQAAPAPDQATPTPGSPDAVQPAADSQTSPAPVAQDTAATATQPVAPAVAATTPAAPRMAYPGMTPEERSKQEVAQECADLLKLATDLKSQVDKARKDELSVSVVRKATEIEQMAHKVRSGTALSASK